mmetsp:Transcript_10043/g.29673  ORF Transcript_10043/g.29673 Transcript_10043/m.29673 type:complete len:289 (+) Transcript_10043:780-1646(+)
MDHGVAVQVQLAEDEVRLRRRDPEGGLERLHQFSRRDRAVAVDVQCAELCLEVVGLLRDEPASRVDDERRRGAPYRALVREAADTLEDVPGERHSGLLTRGSWRAARERRQPGVLQRFLGGGPSGRVDLQVLLGEVLGEVADAGPALGVHVPELGAGDRLGDALVRGAVEGRLATEQGVRHHAHRPHVAGLVVPLPGDDLRRHVVQGARERAEPRAALREHAGQAEVEHLQGRTFLLAGVEEVGVLQVPVAHLALRVAVAVVHGAEDLTQDGRSALLVVAPGLQEAVA